MTNLLQKEFSKIYFPVWPNYSLVRTSKAKIKFKGSFIFVLVNINSDLISVFKFCHFYAIFVCTFIYFQLCECAY